MRVFLRLYGPLRDKLPRENRGRKWLELADGATVSDALASEDIHWEDVLWAINEEHNSDPKTVLNDGEELSVFTPVAGG